ncbi:MAG: hypothetical protein GY847_17175 [Proteobacteria bacterium]|nr:hypothetical protein [Pseudomonadota bacterium]
MVKLIKSVIVLVVIVGIGYFIFVVPLGTKTLYRHVVGISETEEAKELKIEIEKKVKETAKEISAELKQRTSDLSEAKKEPVPDAAKEVKSEAVEHSKKDREALDSLLENKDRQDGADRHAVKQPLPEKDSKTN